jgi:antitoxin HicB
MRYRIHTERDDNDTLLVTCPDLPEVVTFGTDAADAHLRARDAIVTALQGRIAAREDIPESSGSGGEAVDLGTLLEAKVALYRLMRTEGVTKAELARRLNWHGPSVDRLLDLDHDSRFGSMAAAFRALGREMHIAVEEPA